MAKNNYTFLKELAIRNNISIENQNIISKTARTKILEKYNYDKEQIKKNFDQLIYQIETKTYDLYLEHEKYFGQTVLKLLIEYIQSTYNCTLENIGIKLGDYFKHLDSFFLSLSQSRRSRAGQTFENSLKNLFKSMDYPFDEQQVIDGKPDFLIPSRQHYENNAMDCIIFTAKRTLRERWRQIVTEGAKGLGFYLATIDEKISNNQLFEMKNHKIYIVCPSEIKRKYYKDIINVLTFQQFFEDHLDPAMNRWKKHGVI